MCMLMWRKKMKKTLIIASMALLIATSLVAGTLAVYNVNLGTIANGEVYAKRFELVGGGTDGFSESVAIAPMETVNKTFTVSNYKNSNITETPMELNIDVNIDAAQGKQAIAPLVINVYKVKADDSRTLIGNAINGTGTITFKDGFNTSDVGQTYTYDVEVVWPKETNGSNDVDFQGPEFGSQVTVSVSGTQVTKEEVTADGLIK